MDANRKNAFSSKRGCVVLLVAVCLLQGACSSLPKGEPSLDVGIKDRGVASWYGKEFDGKVTANGDVFDRTAYTAAHRKVPLGSLVRVLNLENGKFVHVRINDRGPYVIGRMLDLSQAAARELDMVKAGTAAVQIEVIGDHRVVPPLPPRELAPIGGMPLMRDLRAAGPDSRTEDGSDIVAVRCRMVRQEALYTRRERRIGSMVAADPLILLGSHQSGDGVIPTEGGGTYS